MRGFSIAVVIVVVVSDAHAERYAVDVTPRGWQADAIAAALTNDLADDEARVVKPGERHDLVVRGELVGRELRFAIVDDRGEVTLGRGVIDLKGVDRRGIAGVIRDELHRITRPHEGDVVPASVAQLVEPEVGIGALAGLTAITLLLVAPLLLRSTGRRRATARTAAAVFGVIVVGYTLVAQPELVAGLGAVVFVAGGLAWGAFAAVVLPFALPPIVGLHRVEYHELGPVLAAWSAHAVRRLAKLALVVVAAAFVLDAYANAIDLSQAIAFGVVAPIVGLAVHLAWRAVVEALANRLDDELVGSDADAWHANTRAYYAGYLARANLDVDPRLLDRVRFLPGKTDRVAVYGGGLAQTRIVIPRAMLEHALAPYGRPHDYLQPRVSTLHWTHWGSGLVMPTEPGAKLASQDDRRPHVTVDEGESERVALGELPTLTGIVEPVALDPRTSYRPEDDPLWLDWDPGEDYDGTDAGDKDYLFGILAYGIAMMQRRDDRGATIALALHGSVVARAVTRVRDVLGFFVRPLVFARTTALADVHASLGGARHHLAQYIAWQALRREDLLTARAFVPVLEQTSRAITSAIASGDAAVKQRIAQLLDLAGAPPVRSQRARFVWAAAIVVGVVGVGALVVQAVRYHATYEDRIAAERAQNERPGTDGNRP